MTSFSPGRPGSDPWMNEQPQLAYVIANLIGMMISFRGTRDWAFRSRDVHELYEQLRVFGAEVAPLVGYAPAA